MIAPALLAGLFIGIAAAWLLIRVRNRLMDIDKEKGQPDAADLTS